MEPCLQCGLCLFRLSPAASGPLLLLFSPRPHPEHSFHTTVPQSTPTCPSLALPPDQFGLLWGFLQHQLPLPNRLSTLKRRHESFLTPRHCLPGCQCWEGRAYACLGVTSVSSEDLAHNRYSVKTCQGLGFPGGTVDRNLPAIAGDNGSVPGLGRSHMLRTREARELQLPSPRTAAVEACAPWSPCSATGEANMKSSPSSPRLEKTHGQQQRPSQKNSKKGEKTCQGLGGGRVSVHLHIVQQLGWPRRWGPEGGGGARWCPSPRPGLTYLRKQEPLGAECPALLTCRP